MKLFKTSIFQLSKNKKYFSNHKIYMNFCSNNPNLNENTNEKTRTPKNYKKLSKEQLNYYNFQTEKAIHQKVKSEKFYSFKSKLSKLSVFCLLSFIAWVASGFYDFVPRHNVEERINTWKENKKNQN